MAEEASNPVPATVTESPTFPLVESMLIHGTIVNCAWALLGAAALSAAVILAPEPPTASGTMKLVVKLPSLSADVEATVAPSNLTVTVDQLASSYRKQSEALE